MDYKIIKALEDVINEISNGDYRTSPITAKEALELLLAKLKNN